MNDEASELFVNNLNLYYWLLHKYCSSDELFENICENGILKYREACIKFDPNREIKFSAYLSTVIKRMIYRYLRSNDYKRNYYEICETEMFYKEDEHLNFFNNNSYHIEKFSSPENRLLIKEIMKYIKTGYSKKEYEVFKEYLNGNIQSDIGDKYGVTQVQVSRIVSKIQSDLRKNFK